MTLLRAFRYLKDLYTAVIDFLHCDRLIIHIIRIIIPFII